MFWVSVAKELLPLPAKNEWGEDRGEGLAEHSPLSGSLPTRASRGERESGVMPVLCRVDSSACWGGGAAALVRPLCVRWLSPTCRVAWERPPPGVWREGQRFIHSPWSGPRRLAPVRLRLCEATPGQASFSLRSERSLVEAAGVEPASLTDEPAATTCLVRADSRLMAGARTRSHRPSQHEMFSDVHALSPRPS